MFYLFIINPISGKGTGKEAIPTIKNIFKDYDYEIFISNYKNHINDFFENYIFKKDTVVVCCGGDGTLNQVFTNIVNKNIKLAIVPIGSGNGLARSLKIPLKIKDSLKNILKNRSKFIDYIKINNNFSLSNFGLGFDSETIKKYDQIKQRKLLGYFKSIFITIFNYKPYNISIKYKDFYYKNNSLTINGANSSQLGYNFSFINDAKLDDGILNLLIVPYKNIFSSFKFLFGFLFKKLNKMYKVINCDKIEIKIENFDNQKYLQIDGESILLKENTLKIECIKKAIEIIY